MSGKNSGIPPQGPGGVGNRYTLQVSSPGLERPVRFPEHWRKYLGRVVRVTSRALKGLDSLLSIAQMPKGVPVATFAIGEAGAANAGLFAVALLAGSDPRLARRLTAFRKRQTARVRAMKLPR